MKTEINAVVQLFLDHREASESELVDKICAATRDRDLAERLVEFLPLAFGRVVLGNIGVVSPDRFVRMLDNGGFTPECPLDAEPLWKPALTFAKEAEARMSKDEFFAIACRSAEIDAVNKALKRGSNPKDLVGSPPILMREAPMPPAQVKKPWQFWK